MALTPEQIDVLYMRNGLGKFHLPVDSLQCEYDHCTYDFARAIEAEVRKQDDTLILQLVKALEESIPIAMGKAEQRNTAIIAGRARLGEKT